MTIYDIAKEAGVSISTVSRVLNNPDKVSRKTRDKVQALIRKHHFTPNAMARGLVSNSMKSIGILTSDIRNYHFASTAYTLETLFFNWGYSTILCNTGDHAAKKQDYLRILAEKKVDGVVLVGSTYADAELEEAFKKYLPDTPIVIGNGALSLPNARHVLIDHDTGMRLAVEHLFKTGHRDIVLVNTSTTCNAKRKVQGFRLAMNQFGMKDDESNIIQTSFGLEGAYESVNRILETRPSCTAIIFADDNTAMCALSCLREKGRSVPKDIAVVGYDDSLFSLYASPQLTSINTKNETYSVLLANMLRDILSNKEVGNSVFVTPEIVVRQSTVEC